MKGLSSHPVIFTAAQAVNEICMPLKKHLGISQFGYNKLFCDGAEIDLGTCPEMIQAYRDEALHQYSSYGAHPNHYQAGHIFWSQTEAHKKILDIRARFQVNEGLTLIYKEDDAVEFFHFETEKVDVKKLSFYSNNLDLFQNFAKYFKQQASKFILDAEKNKFYIQSGFSEMSIPSLNDELLRHSFLNAISQNEDIIQLTSRKVDCLFYLVKGMTQRQVAEKLNLSPKTIEHYVENLKQKFNCNTRSQLISQALNMKVIKQRLNNE